SFIAGLAGGTGRGCWHLLAFKVREVLANLGKETMPVGYFFDASVFKEIMTANPGQANKMRVNSLTGISELHAWMANELHQAGPFNYALPNIDSPRDPSSDLISVSRYVSDSKGMVLRGVPGQSPVTQAFVLFAGGKAGDPGSPAHYYKILANAMYARMVDEIASEGINTGQSFGGAGAASIVVPINDIKEYVGAYTAKFLPELYSRSVDTAKIDEWCDRLTRVFEAQTPFAYSPNVDGNIFERVVFAVTSNQAQRMRRLEEAMDPKKRDYKSAHEECKRVDAWASSKDGKVMVEAISQRLIIETFFGSQPSKDAVGTGGMLREVRVLGQLARNEYAAVYGGDQDIPQIKCTTEAYKRMIMAQTLSIANPNGTTDELDISGYGSKAELATKISKRLKELAKRVPAANATVSSATAEFENARKGFLQSGINVNESSLIIDAAKSRGRMQCMGVAGPFFQKVLNETADRLDRLASDLSQVVTLLVEQSKESEKSCGASRDRLFWTSDDFRRICDQSADQLYTGSILAQQQLQPVADDVVLDAALVRAIGLGSNERFQVAQSEFGSKLDRWLAGDVDGADRNERRREVRRLLTKGMEGLGRELVLMPSFYVEKFGFFGVMRGLLEAWGAEFRRRAGSEQDTQKLKASFRVLFGCDFEFDKDGVVQKSGEELIQETKRVCQCLSVELANRCDVLFHKKLRAGSVQHGDSASVVLPAQDRFDEEFVSQAHEYAIASGRFPEAGFFKVCQTFRKNARGNPFVMLAYAQLAFDWKSNAGSGLSAVASLDYYRDPATARWLAACEDERGLSVFCQDSEVLPNAGESYGLGYSSPIFVRKGLLRDLRWRPWLTHGAAVANERSSFVWDAIAFAMLDEPIAEGLTEAIGSAVRAVTDAESWQMPLIALRSALDGSETQEKKWQFARSPFRNNMGLREASHPACKAGDGFTSIKKLHDALTSSHPNPVVEAIATEAVMFIKDVLLSHKEQVSAEGALTAMFRQLGTELQKAKEAETGHTQIEYQAMYGQLISRVEALQKKSPSELQGHFERRGRI
ncbi:MAG: hypothetical protein EXS15_08585, partial [Phycisphaerales bacterium]|nr:hypothetical protein [Phycisphaerales bacterium]